MLLGERFLTKSNEGSTVHLDRVLGERFTTTSSSLHFRNISLSYKDWMVGSCASG